MDGSNNFDKIKDDFGNQINNIINNCDGKDSIFKNKDSFSQFKQKLNNKGITYIQYDQASSMITIKKPINNDYSVSCTVSKNNPKLKIKIDKYNKQKQISNNTNINQTIPKYNELTMQKTTHVDYSNAQNTINNNQTKETIPTVKTNDNKKKVIETQEKEKDNKTTHEPKLETSTETKIEEKQDEVKKDDKKKEEQKKLNLKKPIWNQAKEEEKKEEKKKEKEKEKDDNKKKKNNTLIWVIVIIVVVAIILAIVGHFLYKKYQTNETNHTQTSQSATEATNETQKKESTQTLTADGELEITPTKTDTNTNNLTGEKYISQCEYNSTIDIEGLKFKFTEYMKQQLEAYGSGSKELSFNDCVRKNDGSISFDNAQYVLTRDTATNDAVISCQINGVEIASTNLKNLQSNGTSLYYTNNNDATINLDNYWNGIFAGKIS